MKTLSKKNGVFIIIIKCVILYYFGQNLRGFQNLGGFLLLIPRHEQIKVTDVTHSNSKNILAWSARLPCTSSFEVGVQGYLERVVQGNLALRSSI